MDYIGTKTKLNDWLFETINLSVSLPSKKCFLDACAGTGAVAKRAAETFGSVISNDILLSSKIFVLGSGVFPVNRLNEAMIHISEINKTEELSGFFHKNYSPLGKRMFFTEQNARKIDACRNYIELNVKDDLLKSYLLYCGIEALSSIINTAGTQEAYLKKFKPRAIKLFELKLQKSAGLENLTAINSDLSALLIEEKYRLKFKEDVLYLDPPYNNRQYGSVYHLYETFIKNDEPRISGVAGKRDGGDTKSLFCSNKNSIKFITECFSKTTATDIFMSYSTDGILSENNITLAAQNAGFILNKTHRKEYKRFKSDKNKEKNYNLAKLEELLFHFVKSNKPVIE